MPRYVDADTWEPYFCEHMDDEHMAAAKNALDDMPTIDAVEVVRCKDCLYWELGSDPIGIECEPGEVAHDCSFHCVGGITRTSEFCCWGERR